MFEFGHGFAIGTRFPDLKISPAHDLLQVLVGHLQAWKPAVRRSPPSCSQDKGLRPLPLTGQSAKLGPAIQIKARTVVSGLHGLTLWIDIPIIQCSLAAALFCFPCN